MITSSAPDAAGRHSEEGETVEDIDLTMLARSAYRAILRSVETAEAEEPETVKEVVPMAAQKD